MNRIFLTLFLSLSFLYCNAQLEKDSSLLSIDRIYASNEFQKERQRPIQWIENGNAYVTIEKSMANPAADELIRYDCKSLARTKYIAAELLMAENKAMSIESFSLSSDGSKVLIFTNSSRVWRTNTKGDYWVYDLHNGKLKQLGSSFPASSLMFAKFSSDNAYVAYVHNFNIYKEHFNSGKISQLTTDGNRDIINGTFDWAYEEEFGKRDGFIWNPDGSQIAYWQIDASDIGTFYMINNTDSIYSKPIPMQYPKVGQEPAGAKVGLVNTNSGETTWIPLPGGQKENYIPGIQWVHADLLLLQQMNRKQNQLLVWAYTPSSGKLTRIYSEYEDTWVDLGYPDISANGWGNNDLPLVDEGKAFLRMTETDGWRHVYKIGIYDHSATLLTPGDYDVASFCRAADNRLYFIASPNNSTQRYLYQIDLQGKGNHAIVTPETFSGVNLYDVSPNGKFAIHSHENTGTPLSVRLISLPQHKTLKTLVSNLAYKEQLAMLMPVETKFMKVTTKEGVELDVRMTLPMHFDPTKKYPVIFHVYGEPWGQVATDREIGLWDKMMAQKGYVIIDMDNRGTPCLKGSAWRKSIYRQIGRINAKDQAEGAEELLKLDFLDSDRVAVWGWSGGGSMTLNLMFQYPEIYKTGFAVAAVPNQLLYDNIYQERYMGLPQENEEDFIAGSPMTYAKNLKGNLMLVHGTADDNVHYQGAEMLINELIKHNKQFQMMSYPNRSHSIYEGDNTRRHLFSLLTNYIQEKTPPNKEGDMNKTIRP